MYISVAGPSVKAVKLRLHTGYVRNLQYILTLSASPQCCKPNGNPAQHDSDREHNKFDFDIIYMEIFFSTRYLREKSGRIRGRRAKHVRYDISKV